MTMAKKPLSIVALAAICLTTACDRRGNGSATQIRAETCATHVYCRDVTEYPEIPEARAGTREALIPFSSVYTGNSYDVSVYLPATYHENNNGYPVIYSLDGDSNFEIRSRQIDRQQKDVILVSIHSDATRQIDYLYFDGLGERAGGRDFYDYIVLELIPYVEAQYRIDAGRRAIEGHSHGGNFVAYTIFEDALGLRYFDSFVAIEASLWINEGPLRDLQTMLSTTANDLDIDVFLSSGVPGPFTNGDVTESLYDYFVETSFENLIVHYYSYDLDHGAVALPAFADFLHERY
jgi:predicted alpha/beta superfamily hydrolase